MVPIDWGCAYQLKYVRYEPPFASCPTQKRRERGRYIRREFRGDYLNALGLRHRISVVSMGNFPHQRLSAVYQSPTITHGWIGVVLH